MKTIFKANNAIKTLNYLFYAVVFLSIESAVILYCFNKALPNWIIELFSLWFIILAIVLSKMLTFINFIEYFKGLEVDVDEILNGNSNLNLFIASQSVMLNRKLLILSLFAFTSGLLLITYLISKNLLSDGLIPSLIVIPYSLGPAFHIMLGRIKVISIANS